MTKNRKKDSYSITEVGTLIEAFQTKLSVIAEQVADLSNWRFEVNERFDKIDERFDRVDIRFFGIETRLDKVEGRLGRIEDAVGSGIPDLNCRVTRLETKIKI